MDSNNTQVPQESKMSLPHVTSFCCCMGLEAGTKIIGYLHTIFAIGIMILSVMFCVGANEYKGTVEDAEDKLYSSWYIIAVIISAMSAVHMLLAATLVFSVHNNSTKGLRSWVKVMMLLCLASVVYIVAVSALYGTSDSGSDIFVSFLEGVVFFAIVAYFIITVNSYYLMLKRVEDMAVP